MARNTYEMWSCAVKIAFFSKKLQKLVQRLGASPPDLLGLGQLGDPPKTSSVTRLRYVSLLYTTPTLDIFDF